MTSVAEAPIPQFGTQHNGIVYVDRPGVYAVIQNSKRQIAVIRTSRGYFLPGGGMESGESETEALEREINEEIGYQTFGFMELGQAIEYINAHDGENHYRIHSRFYKVQLGSKVGEGIEKDHELIWLEQADAHKLLQRQGQGWAVQRMGNG
jgi:8-oxo-dGTP diphosphatase